MSIDGQGTLWRRNIAENFNRLSRAHERYRQTTDDRRQTDGRSHIANMNLSSRSLKIENCKNYKNIPYYFMFIILWKWKIAWIVQTVAQWVRFLANVNSSSCSLYVIVRPSVVCLSVTFVRPTQAIEIFGIFSSPFGTLAICWHLGKILRRSSHGNPSVGGVKHNRGSRI